MGQFKARELPKSLFSEPSKLPTVIKKEITKPLPVSLQTDKIKKKQLISTEELELQECAKQVKATPVDPRVFDFQEPERKSCPPIAPQFKEFNFAIASRPKQEVAIESFTIEFRARPLPDLSKPV